MHLNTMTSYRHTSYDPRTAARVNAVSQPKFGTMTQLGNGFTLQDAMAFLKVIFGSDYDSHVALNNHTQRMTVVENTVRFLNQANPERISALPPLVEQVQQLRRGLESQEGEAWQQSDMNALQRPNSPLHRFLETNPDATEWPRLQSLFSPGELSPISWPDFYKILTPEQKTVLKQRFIAQAQPFLQATLENSRSGKLGPLELGFACSKAMTGSVSPPGRNIDLLAVASYQAKKSPEMARQLGLVRPNPQQNGVAKCITQMACQLRLITPNPQQNGVTQFITEQYMNAWADLYIDKVLNQP